MNKKIVGLACCLLIIVLSGCATKPTDPYELKIYEQNNDPLEPLNRKVFSFNLFMDDYILNPIAKGYRAITPQFIRTGISNFFTNIKQPVYFTNSILQGDMDAAGDIGKRFLANTVWGFFGLFDPATELEIPAVKRDFGETLAVWGVENGGPYLMLPFWGASNFRDASGMAVDAFLQPLDYLEKGEHWITVSRWSIDAIQKREKSIELVDNVKQSSMDLYATMRSMAQQNRQKEINEILEKENSETPQMDYDFDFPDDEDY